MIHKFSLSSLLIAASLILAQLACLGGQSVATSQPVTTDQPISAETRPAEATPIPASKSTQSAGPVGGPGSFNLAQPGAHLDSLSRYQAELKTSFAGTKNGQSFERSSHLTLSYAGPAAQATYLESTATGETPVFLVAGQAAGTRFLQFASDAPCSSLTDSQDSEVPTFGDPWSELPAVYGAELVGAETVNTFETEHYTFNQRAIRWAASTTAQGELWVAKAGGFLVRYRLTMDAQPGVLSSTSGGKQTWEFDLNPLAEDARLLPEGCAAALTGFAMLPDASAALSMPGYLSYSTGQDTAAASEFYRSELTGAGWEEKDAFNALPERTVMFFVRPIKDGENITAQEIATITLRPTDAGLKVEIQVIQTELPPATGGQ